jgi:hypothetical protein
MIILQNRPADWSWNIREADKQFRRACLRWVATWACMALTGVALVEWLAW